MNAKEEEAATKKSEDLKQDRMIKFQGEEVERLIAEMEVVFKFKTAEAADAEIKRCQENSNEQSNSAVELSLNMQGLMKGDINLRDEIKINKLHARYNDVVIMKNAYTKEHEVLKRDLDKKNTFEVSKLNIKLMKFKGYDSADDIYTFSVNQPQRDYVATVFFQELNIILVSIRMIGFDEIFIRLRSHKVAFHTDVAKMYNAVKLNQDDWCFQRKN